MSKYTETEIKIAADKVEVKDFLKWISKFKPSSTDTERVNTDVYYERKPDTAVVRHRHFNVHPFESELTIKIRKTYASTESRREYDLKISGQTSPEDVEHFMQTLSYKPVLVLTKSVSTIRFPIFFVVIYDVWREGLGKDVGACFDPKRFIEIEMGKGLGASNKITKQEFLKWRKAIKEKFKIDTRPMNRSLWELYYDLRRT